MSPFRDSAAGYLKYITTFFGRFDQVFCKCDISDCRVKRGNRSIQKLDLNSTFVRKELERKPRIKDNSKESIPRVETPKYAYYILVRQINRSIRWSVNPPLRMTKKDLHSPAGTGLRTRSSALGFTFPPVPACHPSAHGGGRRVRRACRAVSPGGPEAIRPSGRSESSFAGAGSRCCS